MGVGSYLLECCFSFKNTVLIIWSVVPYCEVLCYVSKSQSMCSDMCNV